jgi:hypothetical protein
MVPDRHRLHRAHPRPPHGQPNRNTTTDNDVNPALLYLTDYVPHDHVDYDPIALRRDARCVLYTPGGEGHAQRAQLCLLDIEHRLEVSLATGLTRRARRQKQALRYPTARHGLRPGSRQADPQNRLRLLG